MTTILLVMFLKLSICIEYQHMSCRSESVLYDRSEKRKKWSDIGGGDVLNMFID